MMRIYQARAARKASRKAITENATTGLIAWIRTFNQIQMGLALGSLALSIILLFIGTYVYFDASIVGPSQTLGRSSVYDSILSLYGINETNFAMLFPVATTSAKDSTHFKLINYQIGISMMFVGAISILVEVGLICAVLFEHFKLSLLYTVLMAAGLIHGISSGGQLYALSLTFQIFLLLSFVVFSLGIKVKSITANQILDKASDIELRNEQQTCLNDKAQGV